MGGDSDGYVAPPRTECHQAFKLSLRPGDREPGDSLLSESHRALAGARRPRGQRRGTSTGVRADSEPPALPYPRADSDVPAGRLGPWRHPLPQPRKTAASGHYFLSLAPPSPGSPGRRAAPAAVAGDDSESPVTPRVRNDWTRTAISYSEIA